MHDAYVRGNAWSTVRQMLYAIRHYNVQHQEYDILKGKPRLSLAAAAYGWTYKIQRS